MTTQQAELHKAITLAGSQAQLARELKLGRAMVNRWWLGTSPISITRARQIENWSRGKISKTKLVFG